MVGSIIVPCMLDNHTHLEYVTYIAFTQQTHLNFMFYVHCFSCR